MLFTSITFPKYKTLIQFSCNGELCNNITNGRFYRMTWKRCHTSTIRGSYLITQITLVDAQYRSILNAVHHGYIIRNIMNILTEYTIYGCQNITLVMTKNYYTRYTKHYDILSDT
jgi:hypothetical protein